VPKKKVVNGTCTAVRLNFCMVSIASASGNEPSQGITLTEKLV
jgi:hypothetical protein